MKCSDETNELYAALAKAQGAINNPTKGALNPHFKSRYADLSDGLNAVRAGLADNGLAVVQATRTCLATLMLDTRLGHSSGQWIESEFPVIALPAAPQPIGSALTYARRYSLFAIVGIAGDDDDGNAASAQHRANGNGARQTFESGTPAFLSPAQVEELEAMVDRLDEGSRGGFEAYIAKAHGAQMLSMLPAHAFAPTKVMLERKLATT